MFVNQHARSHKKYQTKNNTIIHKNITNKIETAIPCRQTSCFLRC